MIQNIEHNVKSAGDYIEESVVQTRQVVLYQSKARKVRDCFLPFRVRLPVAIKERCDYFP